MPPRITLRPTDSIDLHMHTWASDGGWDPPALAQHLADRGFRVIAVADHDTMYSVPAMQREAVERGMILIPAVEVTTRWNGRQVHVLIYGIDLDSSRTAAFRDLMALQREQLRATAQRAADLIEHHGRRIPALAEMSRGLSLTPHHVFTAMIRAGHGHNLYQAHNIVRSLGEPVIVDVPIGDTIAAAHEAGAIAIVAHPGRDEGNGILTAELLDQLRQEAPVDGVEAHYRSYKDADVQRYRDWADERRLLVSTGSDSHRPAFPVDPIAFEARWSAALLERLGIEVEPWDGPAWEPATAPEPVAATAG